MMGDHQHCLSFSQLVQGFLYQVFVFGVGKSCCFVQDNNRRIFQDGPGQDNALLFPSRKECSIYSYLRVQSVG